MTSGTDLPNTPRANAGMPLAPRSSVMRTGFRRNRDPVRLTASREEVARKPVVSKLQRSGSGDADRRGDVLHRLFDEPGRSGAGARGARLRVGLGAGALAYPAIAQDAVPRRRRPAEAVLRRDGPVRQPVIGRRRDEDDQGRDRRLSGDPARHDPDRQAGRLARPGIERPLPVRHRRRLEPGRDGGPRHGLCGPLQEDARADRGHARRSGPGTSRNTTARSSISRR